MTEKMNITKLRNELIDIFEKLRNEEIGIQQAKEMSNSAGKIISTAKAQLEYNKYCGSKDAIEFMIGN
jgi:hypothetical protein